jgi:hypothetical protein
VFSVKRAWSSAPAPLPVVRPADHAVPPERRHVFVNDRDAAVSQHTIHLVQHEPRIVRVMQDITEQHGIKTLVLDGKMPAIVRQIIDARGGAASDVQADHGGAEHRSQVVCNEAVATAYVENVGARRQHPGDFECHVVCSPDLAASSHALEAALDGCG